MSASSFSRRDFLKTTSALAATSVIPFRPSESEKRKFPLVDGLCVDILSKPEDIQASGLTALLADVSHVDEVKTTDGSIKWMRTFDGTVKAIVQTRQKLRQLPKVFLGSSGSDIWRAFDKKETAIFLQVQGGGEIVDNDLSRIDLLQELGLRVLQITHHNNNPLGGGSMENPQSGLTKLGHEAIEHMNKLGVIPDLSHASDATALDTIKTSKKPVIISHGAARALVNNARCTPDNVIRGIADSGGVMGFL